MKVELIGTGCIGTKQNSASSIVNKKNTNRCTKWNL